MENGKKVILTEKPVSLEKVKELIENITRYKIDCSRLMEALTDAVELYPIGVYRLEFDMKQVMAFMIFPRHSSKYNIVGISYFETMDARKMRLYVEVVY
jgi:hypothetical protein